MMALNHDKFYSGLHATQDAPEPVVYPLRKRARAELSRWLALLTLKSPVHPPAIGNIPVEAAQTWAVETGHHD